MIKSNYAAICQSVNLFTHESLKRQRVQSTHCALKQRLIKHAIIRASNNRLFRMLARNERFKLMVIEIIDRTSWNFGGLLCIRKHDELAALSSDYKFSFNYVIYAWRLVRNGSVLIFDIY